MMSTTIPVDAQTFGSGMLSRWQWNGSIGWLWFRHGFLFHHLVEVPRHIAITNQLELLIAVREVTEVVSFLDASAQWCGGKPKQVAGSSCRWRRYSKQSRFRFCASPITINRGRCDSRFISWSVIAKRLQAGSRRNPLDQALQEYGRLIKTNFVLDWLADQELRARVGRQLNKGGQLHALRRAIFYANEATSASELLSSRASKRSASRSR